MMNMSISILQTFTAVFTHLTPQLSVGASLIVTIAGFIGVTTLVTQLALAAIDKLPKIQEFHLLRRLIKKAVILLCAALAGSILLAAGVVFHKALILTIITIALNVIIGGTIDVIQRAKNSRTYFKEVENDDSDD